jgi:hypothetical protein
MGSPVDLTLGCSNGYHNEHRDQTFPGDYLESLRKAEEYLRTLEEERRKVEGFKRELPLSIQLLEDGKPRSSLAALSEAPLGFRVMWIGTVRAAIRASKEKLSNGKSHSLLRPTVSRSESGKEEGPALEEFMPLKRRWEGSQEEEEGEDRGAKRPAWMEPSREMKDCEQEQSSVTSAMLRWGGVQRPAGAFLPFLREEPRSVLSRPTPRSGSCADLSLSLGERVASPSGERLRGGDSEVGSIDAGLQTPDAQIAKDMGLVCNGTSAAAGSSSSSRKARRCWSPELHRRFVSALHQLGGSQSIAPPTVLCSQIRSIPCLLQIFQHIVLT